MEDRLAQVLLLTGVPGAGHEKTAFAFDRLGIATADTLSLVTAYDPNISLEKALETNSFALFEETLLTVLSALFADISDLGNNFVFASGKPDFVISIPSLAFQKRVCTRCCNFLKTKLQQPNVNLAVLTADLSVLIQRNRLFGARNSIVMPRRILRAQLAEFNSEIEKLNPIRVNTDVGQSPENSVKKILNHYTN